MILGTDDESGGLLKHPGDPLVVPHGANLKILVSSDHLGHPLPLLRAHWHRPHPRHRHSLQELLVSPEIHFAADKDLGGLGAVVTKLRHPGVSHVLQAVGGHQREADDEHISAGVAQGPQPRVLLLTRGVPEVERHTGAVHLQVLGEAVKHSGQVVLGEAACGEGDQQPCLPHLAIPAHHTLDASHCVTMINVFSSTSINPLIKDGAKIQGWHLIRLEVLSISLLLVIETLFCRQ